MEWTAKQGINWRAEERRKKKKIKTKKNKISELTASPKKNYEESQ